MFVYVFVVVSNVVSVRGRTVTLVDFVVSGTVSECLPEVVFVLGISGFLGNLTIV